MHSRSNHAMALRLNLSRAVFLFGFLPGVTAFSQSEPDTTLAAEYSVQAAQFAKEALYDSSFLYYEKAGAIYQIVAQAQNDPRTWEKLIQCHNGMSVALRRQENYVLALKYLHKALDVGLNKLGAQSLAVANCYHGIGVIYRSQGDNDEALQYFQKSLQIKLAALGERHASVTVSYNSIGNAYRVKGAYDKALEYYRKSLQIGLQVFGPEHTAISAYYSNIGNVCYDKGEYSEALEYFHKSMAIELRVLGEHHPTIASNYNNIGNVYHDKGDYPRALEYHLKALDLRLQTLGEKHSEVAESYFNLGRVYHSQGNFDKALEAHGKALALERETFGESHYLVAESYLHLGNVYSDRNEINKALENYRRALSLQTEVLGSRHPELSLTYQQIGRAYEKLNNVPEALKYYQRAIITVVPEFRNENPEANPGLKQVSNERYLLAALSKKGQALAMLASTRSEVAARIRMLKSSLSTFALATDLMDQIRVAYKAEDSRLLLGEEFADIHRNAVATAMQAYDLTREQPHRLQAFHFMEKSKAAALHHALQESRAKQFAGIPDSLLEEERDLRIDLAYVATEIQKELEKDEAERDQQRLRDLEDRGFAMRRAHERLIGRFERDYPAYYALKYRTKVATVAELQTALDAHSALLEYLVADHALYVAVISKTRFELASIPLDSSFNKLVNQFHRSLKTVDLEDYLQSSRVLYDILLRAIENSLAGKTHLSIIPDGLLHHVPFEALVAGGPEKVADFRTLDYLIKRHEISYHYSATLFLHQNQPGTARSAPPVSGFVGFAPVFTDSQSRWLLGHAATDFVKSLFNFRSVTIDGKQFNELKYSQAEIQSIAEMFKSQGTGAFGYFHAEASEQNFKATARHHKFIHVATHGLLNEEQPELSGLIFSQPKDSTAGDDGVLYSAECYNLDLNVGLVVLSSCESGLGQLVKGEGMLALTRGFLYSGARNVIHSLWKVDDRHTSQLMIELYRNVLEGRSYSQALRAAKLKLIEVEATAFPTSWSSFVLVGS